MGLYSDVLSPGKLRKCASKSIVPTIYKNFPSLKVGLNMRLSDVSTDEKITVDAQHNTIKPQAVHGRGLTGHTGCSTRSRPCKYRMRT